MPPRSNSSLSHYFSWDIPVTSHPAYDDNILFGHLAKVSLPSTSSSHHYQNSLPKSQIWDFPGGTVVKNPPANAGDTGSSPSLGRSHMLRSN